MSRKKERLSLTMTKSQGTWVLIPLSILVLFSALFYSNKKDVKRNIWYQREQGELIELAINVISLLLWPLVIENIIGWNLIEKHPILLVGFMWTVIMILWDITSNANTIESPENASAKNNNTKMNANVIIGASWAVGSLLAVVSKTSAITPESARVLLVSLVLCVAFVVPMMIEVDLRSPIAKGMRTVQRSVLHYAIGLFVTGVAMNWGI